MNELFYNLYKKINFYLFLLILLIGIIIGLNYFKNGQYSKLEETAISQARINSNLILQFRNLYSSEVLSKVHDSDIKIRHDYKIKNKAIPVPYNLNEIIRNDIKEQAGYDIIKFYSIYNFPWREQEVQLLDHFSKNAWNFLIQNPEKEFFEIDNNNILRYAVAETMQKTCIECHNSYPNSPKTDWKEGDVAGIIEINVPIKNMLEITKNTIKLIWLFVLVTIILCILFTIKVYVNNRKLRLYFKNLRKDVEVEHEFLRKIRHHLSVVVKSNILNIENYSNAIVKDDLKNVSDIIYHQQKSCSIVSQISDNIVKYINLLVDNFEKEEVDLDNLVHLLLTNIKKQFSSENIKIKILNKLPTLTINKKHFYDIFSIIIHNSIIYNDNNIKIVEIGFKSLKTKDGIENLHFYINDNGNGIDKESCSKIFTLFYNDNLNKHNKSHISFGLAYIKKIIELYDGKIYVKSVLGSGTQISFSIPKLK